MSVKAVPLNETASRPLYPLALEIGAVAGYVIHNVAAIIVEGFCLSSCCGLDCTLAQAITWLFGKEVKMGPWGRRTNFRRGTGSWAMGDFGGW
jgi:hypothetical protein